MELNVGGTYFTTRLSTLTKYDDSMLAAMFSGRHRVEQDSQGRYFIDRDGSLFKHVLTFLRHDQLPPVTTASDLLDEAEFYHLTGLADWCKAQDDSVIGREDVEKMEERVVGGILATDELQRVVVTAMQNPEHGWHEDDKEGELVCSLTIGYLGKARMGGRGEPLPRRQQSVPVSSMLRESCIKLGVPPGDHACSLTHRFGFCAELDAIIYRDMTKPTLYLRRAIARFNFIEKHAHLVLTELLRSKDQAKRCTICRRSLVPFFLELRLNGVATVGDRAGEQYTQKIAAQLAELTNYGPQTWGGENKTYLRVGNL